MINVYDLKQYIYCPRIIYWYYCAPVKFHESYKMKWGTEKHQEEKNKEIRRSFERYELQDAEMLFEYQVNTDILSGKLDLLLISNEKYVPVEYKFTRSSNSFSHKVQLYGYALILQGIYNTKVDKGFLYYPRSKEIIKVTINNSNFEKIYDIIGSINNIIENYEFPDVDSNESKCYGCEFNLFCNDVV